MARVYMAEASSGDSGDSRGPGARADGAVAGSPVRRWLGRLRRNRHLRGGTGVWRRGWVLAALALLLGLLMLLHARLSNTIGNIGSLVQTFLPWAGLGVPLLLLCALLRRAPVAVAALVLPVVVWLNLFAGQFTDKTGSGGDLTVLTHNVNAENPDPQDTARRLAESDADVVALEEVTRKALPAYRSGLQKAYPHHEVRGTVALWSRYPLSDTRPVDLRLGWTRALRTTVTAPQGPVAVFVAHLPSVRVKFDSGFTAGQRDQAAEQLGQAIAAERLERVVLLGDLNGTMNDGALAPVTSQLRSTQGAAGDGFGFSWPASFPMTRIDQIMVRGMEPVSSWSLPATTSDHLPVAASLDL